MHVLMLEMILEIVGRGVDTAHALSTLATSTLCVLDYQDRQFFF